MSPFMIALALIVLCLELSSIISATLPPGTDATPAMKTIHDVLTETHCNNVCTETNCEEETWPIASACYCDWACHIIRDCCFGQNQCAANLTLGEEMAKQKIEKMFQYMSCSGVKWRGDWTQFWMVTRCPDSNGTLARYCRDGREGFPDISEVPWTDGVVTYRNYYCALCHDNKVSASSLTVWNGTKICNRNDSTHPTCRLDFSYPEEFQGFRYLAFRQCHDEFRKAISSCLPIPNIPENVTANCGRVYAPISVDDSNSSNPIFKNIDCALCNGIKYDSKFTCVAQGDKPNGSGWMSVGGFTNPRKPIYSFKLLLDFERIQRGICEKWEIFDKDDNQCKPVICSNGYLASNELCREVVFLTVFVIGRALAGKTALSTGLNGDHRKDSFGIMNYRTKRLDNDTVVYVDIFSRSSVSFGSSEVQKSISKLFQIHDKGVLRIRNFYLASQRSFKNCHVTDRVMIGPAIGFNGPIGSSNVSGDLVWKISAGFSGVNITSYLCPNTSSALSCPKVLFPKENFQWKYDVPLIRPGSAFALQADEFEVVDDFVFICAQALEDKWSLFNGFLNDDDIQGVATLVGLSLSLAGLAYTIFTYLLLSQLRTLPGKMLMNLCVALFASQLIFLTALHQTGDQIVCSFIAMAEHYVWLATFCWMNAISWNAMKTFSANGLKDKAQQAKSFIHYSLYSWGIPGFIVLACAIIEFCGCTHLEVGYGNRNVCWISNFNTLMYAFALPIYLVVGFNIALFAYTVFNIIKVSKIAKVTHSDKESRLNFWLYVKLSSVMGLTWIFGFLASATNLQALWYVFIVLNTTQGILIGTGFSLNRRVLKLYSTEFSKSRSTLSNGESDGWSSTRRQKSV